MEQGIRWKQRFENFEWAFLLLKSAFTEKPLAAFSQLEKEGLIQRFKYSYELAWKTLKDYLEYSGIMLEQVTPRHVVKKALAARIITDGQVWIDMIEHRNLLSHTYSQAGFEQALTAIGSRYLQVMEGLYLFLQEKRKVS